MIESPVQVNILFHISQEDLDGVTLYPRIPTVRNNNYINTGLEDGDTPRVCFSPFIEGCIQAVNNSALCKTYNIYVPTHRCTQYIPSLEEVPDQYLTGEVWVLHPVKLQFYGIVEINCKVECPTKNFCKDGKQTAFDFIETALYSYSVQVKHNPKNNIYLVDAELDEENKGCDIL